MLSPTIGDELVRYVLSIQVLCLILLPMTGCGSSRLHFWRSAPHHCDRCNACENQMGPDIVTFGQPPMIEDPIIEYTDPRMMPDNFEAVEPQMESVPSNPDFEDVPTPTPDSAT